LNQQEDDNKDKELDKKDSEKSESVSDISLSEDMDEEKANNYLNL
jgi:hypothetical protein